MLHRCARLCFVNDRTVQGQAQVSIIEAIQRAESEQAVYFLLTAYLESVWQNFNGSDWHGSLRLPIDGESDVLQRARLLSSDPAAEAENPIAAEAAEIFRVASERLGGSQPDNGAHV